VAAFCTKCGAPLTPDKQFCTACGAQVTAPADWQSVPAAAPAQPVAPPPGQPFTPPPAQQYAAPMAPPPASGGSALKIVLIIVGVLVGLAILGGIIFAFAVWRISRAVHVEGNGDKVTLSTPGGSISTSNSQTYSASDLGTDVYPGAQNGHGSMKMDLPTGSMVTAVFVTSDSKDQVAQYYKNKLGSGASVMDTPETTIITLVKGDHEKGDDESVMVTITANSSQNEGKTKIAIVHSKSRKSS